MNYAQYTEGELYSAIEEHNEVGLGVDAEIVRLALTQMTVETITALEHYLTTQNKAGKADPFLADEIMFHVIDRAVQLGKERAIELLAIFLRKRAFGVVEAVASLGQLEDDRVLPLLYEVLPNAWKSLADIASKYIIHLRYQDQMENAVAEDESDTVRLYAAQQLEAMGATQALINGLQNGSAAVRRLAAWYMGRKRVYQAVHTLIEKIQVEQDDETLRAIIWSLGMLRANLALSYLDRYALHPNAEVARTADQARNRIRFNRPI